MNIKKYIVSGVAALVTGIYAVNYVLGESGVNPVWNYSGKTGIGTSYEAYTNGQYLDSGSTGVISKVWFSLTKGIITETAYGRIDKAQIKDLQFLITGDGFFHEEKKDTVSTIEYLDVDSDGRPRSLAYKIINTAKNGAYTIEKHIFTDPNGQALFMRVWFTAHQSGITPYLLLNPYMKNNGWGDTASVTDNELYAYEGDRFLCVKVSGGTAFTKTSAGFVGETDGWQDLNDNGVMDWEYDETSGSGNVALMGQLNTVSNDTHIFNVAAGFGSSKNDALAQADTALSDGYDQLLNEYTTGWNNYLAGLTNLGSMSAFTGDRGRLLHASALVLKAQEDKENPGALIASLSIPWGDTVNADESGVTGYRGVWARDFYQCASALLALGDTQTPLVSFRYLKKIQVNESTPGNEGVTGWFLQKTKVTGDPEWVKVQTDQTANPIMLGWKLWKAGLLGGNELKTWYDTMLKKAADFLCDGGAVKIQYPGGSDYSECTINGLWTQMERWEEQSGYSPSTSASVITGLVCASEIAGALGYQEDKTRYYTKAVAYNRQLDSLTYTTSGFYGNGQYYVRISPTGIPNDSTTLASNNGQTGRDQRKVMDIGFLELVRYNLRKATSQKIINSLIAIDSMSNITDEARIHYRFDVNGTLFDGWRRYGFDGYGERTSDGSNWLGSETDQRGRVWPFFTGERGHYELVKAIENAGGSANVSSATVRSLVDLYVKGIEHFANEGLMIPEQVWDGVGGNTTHNFQTGEGTNSATPLAWSHAEYVKLVRSLRDKKVWDTYTGLPEDETSFATNLGNAPVLTLTGEDFASWDPANTEYELKLVADYTWELVFELTGDLTDSEYKIVLNNSWDTNWGAGSGTDTYLQRDSAANNAAVSLTSGMVKLTIIEGGSVNDPLHAIWDDTNGTGDAITIHFREWEYATGYSIHIWDWAGSTTDRNMDYEGLINNEHWWKILLNNVPLDFKFCFFNTNGEWDGITRLYNGEEGDLYVRAFDSTLYSTY